MPKHQIHDESTLVQVIAWCYQATSYYLSQCWPSLLSPHGVTRPQWVKMRGFQIMGITIPGKLVFIWVRSLRCVGLVTWFCYQLKAKPGHKTAAPLRPNPYWNGTQAVSHYFSNVQCPLPPHGLRYWWIFSKLVFLWIKIYWCIGFYGVKLMINQHGSRYRWVNARKT